MAWGIMLIGIMSFKATSCGVIEFSKDQFALSKLVYGLICNLKITEGAYLYNMTHQC
jgi:hypothetical protein